MFWAETVPAFIFFLFMFIVPESPRWLVKNGKDQLAGSTLEKVGGAAYAADALAHIKESMVNEIEKVNFKELLEPKMLKILLIGVVLAVFQQWCGINVIFNYAHEIFTQAGYGVSDMLLNIVITGIVNLLFTFVAIYTVDRWGRRKLMLIGSAGLAVIFLLVGASYFFKVAGIHLLILVVAAIACYSCTLAPITWVIISEIFPNRIRGAAMSISVTMLWVACFVLTSTFPLLNKGLGAAGTFWIYASICVLGFIFIIKRLPETKGKTLEEIEIDLVGEK
jgi:SP family sugar porter-like MFS transporter